MKNFYNFQGLVERYASDIIITQPYEGKYDYENGGEWIEETKTYSARAAVFNMSARELHGYSMQFGEGGTFVREAIRIHIHEDIIIGSTVTWKNKDFLVTNKQDYADEAHGLRIYIARRADDRRLQDKPQNGDFIYGEGNKTYTYTDNEAD